MFQNKALIYILPVLFVHFSLYPLDFGALVNLEGSDPDQWTVEKVWYSGTIYDSLDDLADKYANDPQTNKTRVQYVKNSKTHKTTQALRGDPAPRTPKRPPVQVIIAPYTTKRPPVQVIIAPHTPCADNYSTPHSLCR